MGHYNLRSTGRKDRFCIFHNNIGCCPLAKSHLLQSQLSGGSLPFGWGLSWNGREAFHGKNSFHNSPSLSLPPALLFFKASLPVSLDFYYPGTPFQYQLQEITVFACFDFWREWSFIFRYYLFQTFTMFTINAKQLIRRKNIENISH